MKLTVLVDNNTLIDRYFYGEPGVSYYIEDGGKAILYDVGYSDAFIVNAQKLQINLLKLYYLILSHGHLDHTWGLDPLIKMYLEADTSNLSVSPPTIVAHPRTFYGRPRDWLGESGPLLSKEKVSVSFPIKESTKPVWLTKNLVWLGSIPLKNDFECQKPYKKIRINGKEADDYMEDEIALAYKSTKGLVVISACSHRGICNIIEYAKNVCNEDRVVDVIGGFHLMSPEKEVMKRTVEYFKSLKPSSVHACHCTDLYSKIALAKEVPLEEVGVGLVLQY